LIDELQAGQKGKTGVVAGIGVGHGRNGVGYLSGTVAGLNAQPLTRLGQIVSRERVPGTGVG